jgi:hypothetical protein
MKPRTPFSPHLDRYHASLVMSSMGVAVGAAAWVLQVPVIAGGIGLIAAYQAWKQYKDGTVRQHGVDVEALHVAELAAECQARGWQLDTDVWMDGIGNLDAVVIVGIARFVVEIKSYWGLRELSDGSVVRCDKLHQSAAKEVDQVQRQVSGYAYAFNFKKPEAILWCPSAPQGTAKTTGAGVGLVNGTVKLLCGHIARVATSLNDDFMARPASVEHIVIARPRQLTALETIRTRRFV